MVASALVLALSTGAAAAADARIALRGDALRISDIAIVAPQEDRVVAELPRRSAGLALTEAQRRDLLRNRVPGDRFRLRHAGTIWVDRGPAKKPAHALRGVCYVARTDLAAGVYLDRDAVAETECAMQKPDRRLGYDAEAQAAIARDVIPAGTYLGRLRLDDQAPVAAGKAMVLRTRVGPVIVERTVTAVQPGRHGKRLFVRTDDGRMLAPTLAGPSVEETR